MTTAIEAVRQYFGRNFDKIMLSFLADAAKEETRSFPERRQRLDQIVQHLRSKKTTPVGAVFIGESSATYTNKQGFIAYLSTLHGTLQKEVITINKILSELERRRDYRVPERISEAVQTIEELCERAKLPTAEIQRELTRIRTTTLGAGDAQRHAAHQITRACDRASKSFSVPNMSAVIKVTKDKDDVRRSYNIQRLLSEYRVGSVLEPRRMSEGLDNAITRFFSKLFGIDQCFIMDSFSSGKNMSEVYYTLTPKARDQTLRAIVSDIVDINHRTRDEGSGKQEKVKRAIPDKAYQNDFETKYLTKRQRSKPDSLTERIREFYTTNIADPLEQDKGIIHNDLHFDNIRASANGRELDEYHLIDFGMARIGHLSSDLHRVFMAANVFRDRKEEVYLKEAHNIAKTRYGFQDTYEAFKEVCEKGFIHGDLRYAMTCNSCYNSIELHGREKQVVADTASFFYTRAIKRLEKAAAERRLDTAQTSEFIENLERQVARNPTLHVRKLSDPDYHRMQRANSQLESGRLTVEEYQRQIQSNSFKGTYDVDRMNWRIIAPYLTQQAEISRRVSQIDRAIGDRR
jgi:aminoglycoside phosphotransferase (APT) family kinase protein